MHLLGTEKKRETSSSLPKMNIYDGQRVMRHLWTKLECIQFTYRTKRNRGSPSYSDIPTELDINIYKGIGELEKMLKVRLIILIYYAKTQ